jgi:predicted lipoprotein with Yx(FWY)xxD motif
MTTRENEQVGALARRLTIVALALALATVLATSALAGGLTVRLGAASNKTLGKTVVVNQSGRTLYQLTPETSHHLLCKSKECLKFWPPLTVPSRATKLEEAAGVHGKLGLLRRSNGAFQVTLRGVPLYRFSGDHGSGQANGEGIESFGGVWHAMTAAVTSPSSNTTPSAPTSSEPYGY